jgi:hypothetical protein
MPFRVLADVEPPPDELVVAGAAAVLEDCVVAGAAEVLDVLEELEPHAATPIATTTSSSGASRRIDRCVFEFMNAPSTSLGKLRASLEKLRVTY